LIQAKCPAATCNGIPTLGITFGEEKTKET
jgi:hypothetical protein